MIKHLTGPSAPLRGTVTLPADKSISHRTVLFASIADGVSRISGYSDAADPASTVACMRQLGVQIDQSGSDLVVHGGGLHGLRQPTEPLDCGNSGTTMRLLAGILAGQPWPSELIGDDSLSSRPMERIARPLRAMGAEVSLTDGHAPIRISGGTLTGIEYRLPVASAQVKSCVLLAGHYATGTTSVIETEGSRDHTERMLGLPVKQVGPDRVTSVNGGSEVSGADIQVPRDFSAAAFFLVAGSIVPNSEILIPSVGMNPSRTSLMDALLAMGADITASNERLESGEPVSDLTVRSADLRGVAMRSDWIPIMMDEIPVLAVAAVLAEGKTEIRGARELRVKECDRIDAMVRNLTALGGSVEEFEDGMTMEGPQTLGGGEVEVFDDHRIAMAMAVAALRASGEVVIKDAETAEVSFPSFWTELAALSN